MTMFKLYSFSKLSGAPYFESVACGPCVALMTWHAPFIRGKYGRLGMLCLSGPPNLGKTKELMVSLNPIQFLAAMSSSISDNVTPFFLPQRRDFPKTTSEDLAGSV